MTLGMVVKINAHERSKLLLFHKSYTIINDILLNKYFSYLMTYFPSMGPHQSAKSRQ